MKDLVDEIKNKEFVAESNDYSLSEDDVKTLLKKLDTSSDKGYGAVLFAGLLNKGKPEATYDVVIFDIASKKILIQKKITSKARGFGLRNFWAFSVHGTLKQVEKMKLY